MEKDVLKIDNLTKRFGDIIAVDNLRLGVKKGEVYGFLGPNGAGKTTTLRCCCGLLKMDGGFIEVCNERVSLDSIEFRKKMAFIPDRPYLYEKLTAWEYLTFVCEVRKLKGWEKEADYYFEYLELSDGKYRLIEGFSHGMKQKLVIISSILHKPELLLIDEPMVGLDPKSSRKVKELIKKLSSEGCGVVLSTHSLDVAEELSSKIGIINKGKLVAEGTLNDLRKMAKGEGNDLEEIFLRITEEEFEEQKSL